jgi:hypothetical protein
MNITETAYPDIVPGNIEQSKVELSNKIIENVYPLFDEVHINKVSENKDLKKELEDKKSQVKEEKEELEGMMKDYNKKKKVKKLLNRLSKLITSGLVYDNNLKMETIVLLKIINKLSEEKLNEQLSNAMKTISKRFSRA